MKINVRVAGHRTIDFDKRRVRSAMRRIGADVRKEARRLVSRRAVSDPGEYPGLESGALRRSIRARVSRSGFLVRIAPSGTGDEFYAAMLYRGTRKMQPRRNYMADALDARRQAVRTALREALQSSLRPRR